MRAFRIPPVVPVSVLAFVGTVALMTWRNREPEQPLQPARNGPSAKMPAATSPVAAALPTETAVTQTRPQGDPRADEVTDAAPPLPVSLNYRQFRDDTGNRRVFRIYNSSTEPLPLDVSIASATGEKDAQYSFVIGPNETKELGAEGELHLAPGELITLRSPNFRVLEHRVRGLRATAESSP